MHTEIYITYTFTYTFFFNVVEICLKFGGRLGEVRS